MAARYVIRIALAVAVVAAALRAQDEGARTLAEQEIKNLLVVIEATVDGEARFGGGIITGADNSHVYIATANHNVRDKTVSAGVVQVAFRWLPDRKIAAVLLPTFDAALDLAVLRVDLARVPAFQKNRPLFDRLGDAEALTRGQALHLLGHPLAARWVISVKPDLFADREGGVMRFESASLYKGHSGGALLNRRMEIVGLLKSDSQPFGEAVSMTAVLKRLGDWKYPVSLRERFRKEAVRTLSAGGWHTCFINSRNETWCWGSGEDGQLGNAGSADSSKPVRVLGGHEFITVSAGVNHTCAIDWVGRAYCWGVNELGQLGDGTTENRAVPVRVKGDVRFRSISAGREHTCGLTLEGDVYCWGGNEYGQLGTGNRTDSPAPVRISTSRPLHTIEAGGPFTCGLDEQRLPWCWGGADALAHAPLAGAPPLLALSAGSLVVCGLNSKGSAVCWVSGTSKGPGKQSEAKDWRQKEPEIKGADFRHISAGDAYLCAAGAKGVACWEWYPSIVSPQRDLQLKAFDAGLNHACGIALDDALYCWGAGGSGQLGNGRTTELVEPDRVPIER